MSLKLKHKLLKRPFFLVLMVVISVVLIIYVSNCYLERNNDMFKYFGLHKIPLRGSLQLTSSDAHSWYLDGYKDLKEQDSSISIEDIHRPIYGITFDSGHYLIYYENVFSKKGNCDMVVAINLNDSLIYCDCVHSKSDLVNSVSPVELQRLLKTDKDQYFKKYTVK